MNSTKKSLSKFAYQNTTSSKTRIYHTPDFKREEHQKKKINRNRLLDLIRKKAPLSIYHLKQISGIDYGTLHRIIRELEFCRLIETSYFTNKQNRKERVISIPQEVKNDN